MSSIALERNEVIIGVDTHKDEHIGVALDGLGGRIGERKIPATGAGYARLLRWSRGLGRVHAFGVEGTGSYGAGLARFLRRQGELVVEVGRPSRRGEAGPMARAIRSMPSMRPARSCRARRPPNRSSPTEGSRQSDFSRSPATPPSKPIRRP
jgi:hypothetical protein